MAPKRRLTAKVTPPASSGEEEEEPTPPPPPPPTKQPQQKSEEGSESEGGSDSESQSESESESESASESESESESESRGNTVKPIASKPMESVETPPAKKQKPEPSPSSSRPVAKRKVKGEVSKKAVEKDLRENESVPKAGDESKKPTPMFQRIWSASDEMELLQGMIEFRKIEGLDPLGNIVTFHHFVQNSLGQEFTDNQLINKIRVLKRKYIKNEEEGKDGQDRAFSNPHEQQVFKLSKKFWGARKSEMGGSGEQTPMLKASCSMSKSNSCDKILSCGLDLDDSMKEWWEKVDASQREEWTARWGKMQWAEMLLLADKAKLIQDKINLIVEACHD